MSMTEPSTDRAVVNLPYVQWGGIFAGAAIAAAVSFVLVTFGSAIGLAVAPISPSWRTPSLLLGGLSGLWVLVIAVGSMAAGGYVAGRMRSTWHVTHTDEVEFRDGVHGLVVWALAITLGAALSAAAAMALMAGAAVGGAADRSDAQSGSAMPVAYETDRLFRTGPGVVTATPEMRDQAGRLLTASITEPRFGADDRAQLAGLVVAATRLTPEAAQARVNASLNAVRNKARAARRAAILLAFTTAASLLVGAAAAWQAACVGGRHRDNAAPPSMAAWRRVRAEVART